MKARCPAEQHIMTLFPAQKSAPELVLKYNTVMWENECKDWQAFHANVKSHIEMKEKNET